MADSWSSLGGIPVAAISASCVSLQSSFVAMAVPRVELRIGTEEIFEALEIPQSVYLKAGKLLQNSPLTGTWLPKAGNPLSTEAAAYNRTTIKTDDIRNSLNVPDPHQEGFAPGR